jgi:hypothetical protein
MTQSLGGSGLFSGKQVKIPWPEAPDTQQWRLNQKHRVAIGQALGSNGWDNKFDQRKKKRSPQIIENNLGRTAARKKSTQLDPKIAKVWACLSEAYLLVQNLQRRPLHVVPKMEEL